jgi:hypothetical protein
MMMNPSNKKLVITSGFVDAVMKNTSSKSPHKDFVIDYSLIKTFKEFPCKIEQIAPILLN